MKKKIMAVMLVAGLMVMNYVSTFAVVHQEIYIPRDQTWMTAPNSVVNDGNYSYVGAGCNAVYPISGADNFTRIQVRVRNINAISITEASVGYVVLNEADEDQRVDLKEGYISNTPIYFQFRGNSSEPAYANVNYYANVHIPE